MKKSVVLIIIKIRLIDSMINMLHNFQKRKKQIQILSNKTLQMLAKKVQHLDKICNIGYFRNSFWEAEAIKTIALQVILVYFSHDIAVSVNTTRVALVVSNFSYSLAVVY